MTNFLVRNPCQGKCDWRATEQWRDQNRLFRCEGCGSEWLRTQPWTPANADGQIAEAVLVEKARP
ncbi:hypothetical protein [Propionibacterium sp. oral taxon 192]|uniref:hypothetical protein n=1 Tax=Propionibacterium sp. oral taxon 192 TaxID=671222 RepID=UPI00039C0394|nr:hypothetical protein [Propionibacterium sp. oral taxon 192]